MTSCKLSNHGVPGIFSAIYNYFAEAANFKKHYA